MAAKDTFTIEISNQLGENVYLKVNGKQIEDRSSIAYAITASDRITITRQAKEVDVTIPSTIVSTKTPSEGVCVCVSSNLSFDLTPKDSLNITIRTGYLPGTVGGVGCGDGMIEPETSSTGGTE